MKCPRCGNELQQASRCGNCGKDMSCSRNGLEVQYKEFPVSELLEIRQKPQTDRPQKNGGSNEHASLTAAEGNRGKPPRKWGKPLVNSIAILLIVLTVIIVLLLFPDFAP